MGKSNDLVQGTLDLLTLKTIALEPKHGWAIAKRKLESDGNEDSPCLMPNGDVVYRVAEGGMDYAYTRKLDGSGRRKLRKEPILEMEAVSPDGRWTSLAEKDNTDKEHPYRTVLDPNAGGDSVMACHIVCAIQWSIDGRLKSCNELASISMFDILLTLEECCTASSLLLA
jgi:hypothetical protein